MENIMLGIKVNRTKKVNAHPKPNALSVKTAFELGMIRYENAMKKLAKR